MDYQPRRDAFRTALEGGRCLAPASVFDPMSACIAEDLGFEIAMFAGSVASMVILGAPDLAVITATEFAEQAHRICRATTRIPLMVDADHGYGNAHSVRRTVDMLETAGVAAMTIEDTALPAGYGPGGESRLISIEEGVGKMRAALGGRSDKSLTIIGRTSALSVTGQEDAIRRCKAYEKEGVDAIFLASLKKRADLEAVRDAIKLPIMLGSAPRSIGDRDELAKLNVRVALQGHQTYAAAMAGVERVMRALREGTHPSDMPDIPGNDFLKTLMRDGQYKKWGVETLGRQ